MLRPLVVLVAVASAGCSGRESVPSTITEEPRATIGTGAPASVIEPRIIDMAAGGDRTCVLTRDAEVICWRADAFTLEALTRESPTKLPAAATQVAVSDALTCARGPEDVWCWREGDSASNPAVAAVPSGPIAVPRLRGADEVAVADHFICSRHGDEVRCIGGGAKEDRPFATIAPHELTAHSFSSSVEGAAELFATTEGPCVRTPEGRVHCLSMRDRHFSQLEGESFPTRVITAAGRGEGLCALGENGAIDCPEHWGVMLPAPPLAAPPSTTTLVASEAILCALDDARRVWCSPTLEMRGPATPNAVRAFGALELLADPMDVVQIVGGEAHVCARTAKDELWCWGTSLRDSHDAWSTPQPVAPAVDTFAIGPIWAAGEAVWSSRRGICSGKPGRLAIATGVEGVTAVEMVEAAGCYADRDRVRCVAEGAPDVELPLSDVIQMRGSPDGSCALRSGGDMHCWLGSRSRAITSPPLRRFDGIRTRRPYRFEVFVGLDTKGSWWMSPARTRFASRELKRARHVAFDGVTMCINPAGGGVVCGDPFAWADGRMDAVVAGKECTGGCGEYGARVVPGLVGEWTPAVADRRGCAFSSEGDVSCWEMASPPHPMIAWDVVIDDVIAIDVAPDHACARKQDGSLHCWGETRFGLLGDGDRRCALAPKPVALPGAGA